MKLFRRTTKKRVAITSAIGGVVGLLIALGYHLYLHSEAVAANSPEAVAEQQAVAQALGDNPAPASSAPVQTAAPVTAPTAQTPTAIPAATTTSVKTTPALSSETYGNQVASFFPGESAQDAALDALGKINSALNVDGIDIMGYPMYSLECEANGQCVSGTGEAIGSLADTAKAMFPVNPADVERGGLKCNVICHDSKGFVIGRDPNFHG